MPPKNQSVEGIVVVIDVGPLTRLGLAIEQTFFNQSKTCLINILQRKLFAEKCRDLVGIVLFGTDTTDNPLDTDGQYQHITVMQSPRLVDWACVTAAESLPRGTKSADWLDALVVAMDLLHDTNVCFSAKKIVLLTDFGGAFSDDQAASIIAGIIDQGIDLSVIGPELDDTDEDDAAGGSSGASGGSPAKGGISWSGKPKTSVQLAGEALVSNIVASVDGIICSFEEAIPHLIFFQKKASSSANWNSLLEIGEDFQIPVTGNIKMKRATPPTWSRCHATDEAAIIIKERTHHRLDEDLTPVDDDQVIDAYKYGTTLVPFSEEDMAMSYSSQAESSQLTVLGFTRSEYCSLPLRAGDQVLVVTAKGGDEEAAVALSAIIQALFELDMVGITRRVYRKGAMPVMGALFPHVTPLSESLVWIPLPYQEDVRTLSFPSLQRQTDALTQQQLTAIDGLIDAMDLCPVDEDSDVAEILEPSSVLSPQLQHFYNCLTDRALQPGRPLPRPQPHVMGLLSVPPQLQAALDGVATSLVTLFPTTKIVARTKRTRDDIFADKNDDANTSKRSREDDDADDDVTVGGRVTQVSTATPRQDFEAMIRQRPQDFIPICQQLSEVLLQLTENMTGAGAADRLTADKIVQALTVYRSESVIISAATYNTLLRSLRELAVARGLTTALWDLVKERGAGLITKEDTLQSDVTEDEARVFIELQDEGARPADQQEQQPPAAANDQDYDDMLDDF